MCDYHYYYNYSYRYCHYYYLYCYYHQCYLNYDNDIIITIIMRSNVITTANSIILASVLETVIYIISTMVIVTHYIFYGYFDYHYLDKPSV